MSDNEWEEAANQLLDNLESNNYENYDAAAANGGMVGDENGDDSVSGINVDAKIEASPMLSKSELVGKLEQLDANYSLTIHKYLSLQNEDVLVEEYCEKLIALNFVPREPTDVELKHYNNNGEEFLPLNLTSECQRTCIFMLVSYFESCIMQAKLNKAESEKVALFEVTTKPIFYCGPLFTFAGHERLSSLKNCLAVQMQRAAAFENRFVMELLLIRVCYLMLKSVEEETVTISRLKANFALLFLQVKYEFTKYKETHPSASITNDITTTTSTTATTSRSSAEKDFKEPFNEPIYPLWRLQNADSPLYFEETISTLICKNINQRALNEFDANEAILKVFMK